MDIDNFTQVDTLKLTKSIQRAEQEKKTRDEELLEVEEIGNIENKGYKARIMEDTEILGNMLKNLETEPMMRLQKQVRRGRHPGVSSELCIQNNEDYPYEYSLHAISLVSNPESELSLSYPFPALDPIDFSKLPLDSKF